MERRAALLYLGAAFVAACGGGGGDAGTTGFATTGAVPGVQPAPTTPQSGLSRNIVAWGDSMTPPFALNLQVLYPDRIVVQQGFLGQTSTVVANNVLLDTEHLNWINVFWFGHNNETDPEAVKADIARSIAHLSPGNDRFIVMSVVNEDTELQRRGGAEYLTIMRLNADLAALYPNNYIDVRGFLVAQYDPTSPDEVTDFTNDVVPRRLRYDEIHLRNEGSLLVAQRVKAFIDARGW